jgi:hypothetical protein
MTDQEKTDLILESMRAEVAAFVKEQGQITSATEYEDQVLALSRKFAAGLVTHSSSKARKSRNAKKKS